MKYKKQKYVTPTIKTEKIKMSLFWDEYKFFDSFLQPGGRVIYLASSQGCFLSGTNVILSSGRTKSIENIKTSESILSYDTQTKQLVENKVQELYIHNNEKEYYVINNNFYVTGNHRVWTNDLEWKRVDELRIGDTLLTSQSEPIIIESIARKKRDVKVYNLHLENSPHTFFANDVLVHNSGEGGDFTEAEKTP